MFKTIRKYFADRKAHANQMAYEFGFGYIFTAYYLSKYPLSYLEETVAIVRDHHTSRDILDPFNQGANRALSILRQQQKPEQQP